MGIKEHQIVHENGDYWVLQEKDAYYVMKNTATHSISDSAYHPDSCGLSIAIARCDYLAKRNQ